MTDALGVEGRRRMTRQLLVGVPLVIGWAWFAVAGPPWLVERGKQAATACLDDARAAHGDPSACRLGAGFAIGRLFPAARARANVVEHDIAQRRAVLTFDDVMDGKPNVARRDAAAAQLIHDAADRANVLDDAARVGAFAPVAAVDLGSSVIRSRLEPAFAALAIGDVAAARTAIARGTPESFDGTTQSAALACLLGDPKRGQALLRAAAAEREDRSGTPDSAVRTAAQHCAATFASVGFDPYVVPSFHSVDAVMARLFDPDVQAGRRASIGAMQLRETTIFRGGTVGALALVAGGAQEATPLELLQTIASPYVHELGLGAMFSATPWQVWAVDDDQQFVDYMPPPWLELAATRYAHAATLAPAQLDPDAARVSDQAAQAPRETLRAAAELAYEFAAGYRLRRGDRAGARTALEQWRALAPADLRRAPLEVAVGDPALALATLDAWQAEQHEAAQKGLQDIADLTRVFALAATGDHAKAHAVAKGLHGPAGAWLVLATAISSGAPVAGLLRKPSSKHAEATGEATAEAALAAIEAKKPVHDFGYLDGDARAVLPAVMVVIAHQAQVAGQDPEVALDAELARRMPSRRIALARAEAARWRKDATAAQLWQTRAEAIEKLFVDDHAVVLAGIAGLW